MARPAVVLVVDDEPHIGRIVQMRLEQGPFDVRLAHTGASALAQLAAEPIDLLVLDLMLPGMNGVDVLRAIRSTLGKEALPCIVLTAVGQDEPIREVMALGVSEVMTKPFSPRRLFARALALTGHAGGATDWEGAPAGIASHATPSTHHTPA